MKINNNIKYKNVDNVEVKNQSLGFSYALDIIKKVIS